MGDEELDVIAILVLHHATNLPVRFVELFDVLRPLLYHLYILALLVTLVKPPLVLFVERFSVLRLHPHYPRITPRRHPLHHSTCSRHAILLSTQSLLDHGPLLLSSVLK